MMIVHPRAVLAAELGAIVARHGDRAREACDSIAEDVPGALESAGILTLGHAPKLAANDDAEHIADAAGLNCGRKGKASDR